MPVLPLIDLLILMGTAFLGVGFVLKSINLTTTYNPVIFGFTTIDFVLMAGICLVFALSLAARTWVKLNEPRLLQRSHSSEWTSQRRGEFVELSPEQESDELEIPRVARADALGSRRR